MEKMVFFLKMGERLGSKDEGICYCYVRGKDFWRGIRGQSKCGVLSRREKELLQCFRRIGKEGRFGQVLVSLSRFFDSGLVRGSIGLFLVGVDLVMGIVSLGRGGKGGVE